MAGGCGDIGLWWQRWRWWCVILQTMQLMGCKFKAQYCTWVERSAAIAFPEDGGAKPQGTLGPPPSHILQHVVGSPVDLPRPRRTM